MTERAALPAVEAPLPDPSPRLTRAFGEVARRMEGLGILNPALEVEAVAFAPWDGHWLGVMVTPWFMNLVLLPQERERWEPLAPGAKRKLSFPAGVYEFIGADDAIVGEHHTCSLFSPMHDFADHASARLVARLAREALFDAAHAEVPVYPQPDLAPEATAVAAAPLSKRDFLRGRIGTRIGTRIDADRG